MQLTTSLGAGASGARPRLVLVAPLANNQMTPRGQRAAHLAEALGRNWDVEVVALPATTATRNAVPPSRQALWRRAAGRLAKAVLLDKWEPWAIRRFARGRPEADAAVMVCAPWSPTTHAAPVFAKAGIPYVVDTGDPWALTEAGRTSRNLSVLRGRGAERRVWEGAAGAVVTTHQQAARLRGFFPDLPIHVRPNGYVGTAHEAMARSARRDSRSLRLAHFGTLSAVRVDIGFLLRALAESGNWDSITFMQFGDDVAGMLESVPAGVRVERQPARPWSELIEVSDEFDACVVVGNTLRGLLPSKAIQCLTMPVPRIAVTGTTEDDALTDYATRQVGWLVVTPGERGIAERVREHVERAWTDAELAPPPEESWQVVGEELANFIEGCLAGRSPAPIPAPESSAAIPQEPS